MPARRNPKKSRTPKAMPLGIDPAAGHGPLPPTLPDLERALEAPLPAVDVPAVVDAPAVGDLPKPTGRPKAPTAGPPQGGGNRSGGGRSQQAGQTRRYAFRRS
ncbi:hypothetical protein AB0A95_33490 [Micromonospora sp. NPDC049230]|uniref:hypothetical protein n=1 Tax=Micromonospora sp. NPDC049230 TaxID=3155502 RepID=UPI0033CF603E